MNIGWLPEFSNSCVKLFQMLQIPNILNKQFFFFLVELLKERNMRVCETALHLIARMKRDWMQVIYIYIAAEFFSFQCLITRELTVTLYHLQTGRKPSGLCGAALYISALSHGYSFSKSDIIKIVHICEVTLTKRLIEFENTDSGSLTVCSTSIRM
jgi:transcription factor IIIB subunit 2